MADMNTCDRCHREEASDQLIWITAEDFAPFDNEALPAEVFAKYDALCEWCYGELTGGCAHIWVDQITGEDQPIEACSKCLESRIASS